MSRADQSTVADVVRQMWASVLEMPEMDVVDASEFFADGGDSLLAVELVVAVSEELEAEVGLDALFMDGTFAAFVAAAVTAVAEKP